jgi:hypothetical protein
MMDIQAQIGSLLERRRARLPAVQKEVDRWETLVHEIGVLNAVVDELRNHPRTPAEVKQGLDGFQTEEVRRDIAKAIELLHVLEARYARSTINIGVSGRARVGKSTLLQSMSGLTDEQIPTGVGLPVTAVRSRILHSTAHQRATLSLHTFATFRDEVLRPYHDELGLQAPPSSVSDFTQLKYPSNELELAEPKRNHANSTILSRLREMQDSLPSYLSDLVGGERLVDLGALRQYVAYPTLEQEKEGNPPRRYLAVRDVRIECKFPFGQINNLGIIDLPGLGELAANAEEYHLAGLQNDVDIVILVKRNVAVSAYWDHADGQTTKLLDKARGFISNRRDFVFIALNIDESESKGVELAETLRFSVFTKANESVEGKHFQVLECDSSDQKSVYNNILSPVLKHLADRLPVMDDEVFEGTIATFSVLTGKVEALLRDIEGALSSASRSSGSTAEDLEHRTGELRKDLAGELAEIVERFQAAARSGDEDQQYVDAVDSSYLAIQSWIESGFGVGRDVWCSDALRQIRVDRNSSPFAARELNRIRVEIGKHYCTLDHYFQGRVLELWNDTASVFSAHFGDLLKDKTGVEALLQLTANLSDASEPCPTLSESVQDLIKLKLEYRTQLHPRVRRELDGLNLQVLDPETGKPHDQIVVEINDAGSESLFRFLTQLAEQAAYRTKKALMQEALTPALVLHAAAEQFEDVFIRSGESEKEFRRLARSYRDDIWPNVFQGIDEANAKFAKVSKAIRSIRTHLGGFAGGNK